MKIEGMSKDEFMRITANGLEETSEKFMEKTGAIPMLISLLGVLLFAELTHKLFDEDDPEDKLTKQLEGDKNDSQH